MLFCYNKQYKVNLCLLMKQAWGVRRRRGKLGTLVMEGHTMGKYWYWNSNCTDKFHNNDSERGRMPIPETSRVWWGGRFMGDTGGRKIALVKGGVHSITKT